MTPAEEDALFRKFHHERERVTGEMTAFRNAIRAAVAAERERCAKKAEWIFQHHFGATDGTAVRLAAAIREGEK